MKLNHITLTVITLCITTVAGGIKAARAASFDVVASGLDNPRNGAFDQNGNYYVTESGRGGDGSDGRCIASPSSQYIPLCAGENGSVIKIAPDGTKTNVLTGLTSIALTPYGEQGAGPADFKFDSQGNAYLLTGLAGDPNLRDTTLKAPDLGKLYKVDLGTGNLTTLADFGQYEAKYNPDGTDVISNPYAMAIKGSTAYVVDGGGNTIYSVDLNGGGIKNVAAFPQQKIPTDQLKFPTLPEGSVNPDPGNLTLPPGYSVAANGLPVSNQSVPTGIAIAPDGTLTVSEYTYYPYPEGKARVFSVDPDTLQATVKDTGFTQLTGVTYDSDGNEYLLQHVNQSEWKAIEQGGNLIGDPSGSIIKIAKDGTRTTLLSGNGLEAASGLTFGPDGYLYTSNDARFEDKGAVIKIDPRTGSTSATKVPEPTSAIGIFFAAAALGAAARKRKRQEEVGTELLSKVEVL